MSKLSVVTVCYNDYTSLVRTITSIQKLSNYIDLEHVVVDGGSTDGTYDYLRNLDQNRLVWISEADNGIFDAFNKGISLCRGEWVHFLNAGDVFTEITDLSLDSVTASCNFLCFSVLKRKKIDYIWQPKLMKGFGFVNVAHPGLVVRRSFYLSSEKYLTSLKYVSDSWFIWHHVVPEAAVIVPKVLVDMEDGGYSTKLVLQHELEKQKLIFSTRGSLTLKVITALKYLFFAVLRFTRVKS